MMKIGGCHVVSPIRKVGVTGVGDKPSEQATAQLAGTNEQLKDELRLIIDTVPAMVFTASPDGFVDYVNQRWLQYLGLPLENVQGWSWDNTIHPDDRARSVDHWRLAMAAGQAAENELRVRRADGEYRWILGRFVPIHDKAGRITRWYGVSTDIDDRKRAEEKLRYSESQLAEAQRMAHVGNWEWDLRNNAVTWSDELYRIFGLETKGIDLAHEAMRYIHPDDVPLILQAIANSLQTKEPYLFSYRVLRPDGQMRIVQSQGQVVSDSQGTPNKVFGTTQDVTENKRAEAALHESAERLRHLSHRLLKAQEEERLRIARELHDEFGQLLAATLLHVQAAQALAGEAARSKLDECTTLLQRAVEEVRFLAVELRPPMLETLGLEATLRWLAKRHEEQTGVPVQVVGHLNGGSGDLAIACFRVVQEALTNILRHSGARHIWLELSQSESVLELTVRDDGVGFNVASTLAQPDRRGHLGLLGMRERAQILGGSLEVDSEPGRGTRIHIRFPVSEVGAKRSEPVA
jgi:two-component system sensor histidine kinase UhpB